MYIKLNENINSGMLYAIAYCEDPDIYSEEFWGWDTESDVGYELMEFGSLIQDADVFDSLEAAEDRADDVLSSIFEDEVFIVGLDPYTPHNLTGFVKKIARDSINESKSIKESAEVDRAEMIDALWYAPYRSKLYRDVDTTFEPTLCKYLNCTADELSFNNFDAFSDAMAKLSDSELMNCYNDYVSHVLSYLNMDNIPILTDDDITLLEGIGVSVGSYNFYDAEDAINTIDSVYFNNRDDKNYRIALNRIIRSCGANGYPVDGEFYEETYWDYERALKLIDVLNHINNKRVNESKSIKESADSYDMITFDWSPNWIGGSLYQAAFITCHPNIDDDTYPYYWGKVYYKGTNYYVPFVITEDSEESDAVEETLGIRYYDVYSAKSAVEDWIKAKLNSTEIEEDDIEEDNSEEDDIEEINIKEIEDELLWRGMRGEYGHYEDTVAFKMADKAESMGMDHNDAYKLACDVVAQMHDKRFEFEEGEANESLNKSKSIKEGTFHWSDNKAAYEAIKVKNALKKAFNTHVFQDDSQNLYIPFNFWGRKDAEKAGVTIDTVGKFLNSIGYKYTGKSEDDEDVYNYLKDDVKIELYEVDSNRYAIHLDFDSEVDDKLDIDTTSFSSYVNTDDVDAVQDLLLDIVERRVKTLGDISISEEDAKNIKKLCGGTLDMCTYDFAGSSDDIVDKVDDYFAMKQYQELHNKHVDESKSIKESTTGDYVEVAYICDGFTNFRVYGGGFKTSDALVAVEDEKGKRLRLTMGDVCEFYTWYDAKGNVIHEPTYYSED